MKKKRGYARIVLLGILALFSCIGMSALAGEAKAAEKPEEQESYLLYLGQEITLEDLPEGKLYFSEEGIVEFVTGDKLRALKAGTTKLCIKSPEEGPEEDKEAGDNGDKTDGEEESKEEETVLAVFEVKENEKLTSVTFREDSFPELVVGTTVIQIYDSAWQGLSRSYRSQNPDVATVTDNGFVTPVSPGTVKIEVTVRDEYRGIYHYLVPIRVVVPKFTITGTNLAKGCTMVLPLADHGNHLVTAVSDKGNIVQVQSVSAFGVTIKALKTGTAVITGSLNGVSFTCRITVTNPKLKTYYGFYQKKKTIKLSVSGLNAASSPKWTSTDSSVASVSQKGKVKTAKIGSAVIQCVVDGKTLSYYLAVSTKTAVKAMRYGYKQVGKKKYSQARRMSAGYFDCSSFVYRSYRAAGRYLVCRTSWAPVAADIAKYYAAKGKRIKASGKYYDLKKLRPGDLICWGGSSAKRNGRYKRIYHISIYIGNGLTMESSSTYNNVVIRDRGKIKKSQVPVVVRP